MPRSSRWADDETGSASLEFIVAALVLLVPLVYLVLVVAQVQAGALAAEGAARHAARVYVQAPGVEAARERAGRAVSVGLDDYGVAQGDAAVAIGCSADGCLVRGADVTVTVRLDVALPLVPDVLGLRNAVSVPIEASATQRVSRFWGAG